MVAGIIIAVVAIALLALVWLASSMFAEQVAHPRVLTVEHVVDTVRKQANMDVEAFLSDHRVEQFTYHSELGYDLRGRIIYSSKTSPEDPQRTVILCHGYTSNSRSMLPYGRLYMDLGFNLVIYDHRWHGESDRNGNCFCTMGLHESEDLVGLASYVRQFFPKDTIWGLHGESMGSATVMMAAPDIENLSFVVEDCGFSTMRGQMQATLRGYHLPDFPFLTIGDSLLRGRYNLDMDKVRPVDCVARTTVPMLFCHGDSDSFVPTAMVHELFCAKKDRKVLQLFEGSSHAMSVLDHPGQYREVLENFLKQYGII